MTNLRTNESGGIFCPKILADLDPSPANLGGCHHCAFRRGPVVQGPDGSVGVVCGLVPDIRFCRRIYIYPNGSWACAKPPHTLEEYRRVTGDLAALEIPPGFVLPRPTTFTLCLACATQGRSEYVPAEPIERVRERLQTTAGQAARAHYPPPVTEPAAQMRRVLETLNPTWAQTARRLEAALPAPPQVAGDAGPRATGRAVLAAPILDGPAPDLELLRRPPSLANERVE